MLERFGRIFGKKEPVIEQQVTISLVVKDLLAGNEVSQSLSPEETMTVDRINKLKGTQFHSIPGYIISVMETGSYRARALGKDFDLNTLHLVMDGKVRRNGISVDLDNPADVDRAWIRYFNEGK